MRLAHAAQRRFFNFKVLVQSTHRVDGEEERNTGEREKERSTWRLIRRRLWIFFAAAKAIAHFDKMGRSHNRQGRSWIEVNCETRARAITRRVPSRGSGARRSLRSSTYQRWYSDPPCITFRVYVYINIRKFATYAIAYLSTARGGSREKCLRRVRSWWRRCVASLSRRCPWTFLCVSIFLRSRSKKGRDLCHVEATRAYLRSGVILQSRIPVLCLNWRADGDVWRSARFPGRSSSSL